MLPRGVVEGEERMGMVKSGGGGVMVGGRERDGICGGVGVEGEGMGYRRENKRFYMVDILLGVIYEAASLGPRLVGDDDLI